VNSTGCGQAPVGASVDRVDPLVVPRQRFSIVPYALKVLVTSAKESDGEPIVADQDNCRKQPKPHRVA
jgi:hypothetical protein